MSKPAADFSGFHSATNRVSVSRRWWIPHRRVFTAAMVLMIPWVLIALPGEKIVATPAEPVVRLHGWPYVHFWNVQWPVPQFGNDGARKAYIASQPLLATWKLSGDLNVDVQVENRLWSSPRNWVYWNSGRTSTGWHLGPLLVNLGIGLGLLAGCAFMLEWRLRCRGRLLKFSIFDAIVVLTMLAIPLGILVNIRNVQAPDHSAIAALNRFISAGGVRYSEKNPTPEWLDRLLDKRSEQIFSWLGQDGVLTKVMRLDIDSVFHQLDEEELDEVSRAINGLEWQKSISVNVHLPWQVALLERLDASQFQELFIHAYDDPVSNELCALIGRFKNLERLEVSFQDRFYFLQNRGIRPIFDDDEFFFRSIASLSRLKNLNVGGQSISETTAHHLAQLKSLQQLDCGPISPKAKIILERANKNLKLNAPSKN